MDDRRFGVSDIDRWAEQGLISRKQARGIVHAEGLDESGAVSAHAHADRGLNITTLFSYFGAFLALTGFALFTAINWSDMATGARVVVLAPVMVALLVAGQHLRTETSYRLGGHLLFLVGTALVPVTLFAVASLFGSNDSGDFLSEDDLPAATALLALSVVLTAGLTVRTRVHQAALVPATLTVTLGAVAAAWAFGTDNDSQEVWSAIMAAGGLLVLVSLALAAYKEREYGFWTGLAGHVSFYAGATALLSLINWTPASGAAFLLIYTALLLLSVPLQNRVFLVAGVIGVYTFVFRLTAEAAAGPALPLAFAAIGVSLIVVAMLYQRARHQWATGLP